jgi:hypothetical protein
MLMLLVTGGVLLGAVGLQFARLRDASGGDVGSPRETEYFAGKVPIGLAGWSARELPLGNTELLAGQVSSMLNFDAFVFREFARGTDRIAVYAAYWRPGRMPVSRVVSHTPDRCWTENGWNCETMVFNERWSIPTIGELQPAQRRVFRSPVGAAEHVAFWHFVNGEPFDFGERFTAFTDPKMWIKQTLAYAALGSGEQCFIRITSDRPFEHFRDDPGWLELMAALGKLGLAETGR